MKQTVLTLLSWVESQDDEGAGSTGLEQIKLFEKHNNYRDDSDDSFMLYPPIQGTPLSKGRTWVGQTEMQGKG